MKKELKPPLMETKYCVCSHTNYCACARVYEDFDPYCKWRKEEERDTIEVHLQGTVYYSFYLVLVCRDFFLKNNIILLLIVKIAVKLFGRVM